MLHLYLEAWLGEDLLPGSFMLLAELFSHSYIIAGPSLFVTVLKVSVVLISWSSPSQIYNIAVCFFKTSRKIS